MREAIRFLYRSVCLLALCMAPATLLHAHNVAMVETMKYFAPETVDMLIFRAQAGGPYGLQVGDQVKYIIKYKPVPNGGNTGVNGYITDYIPTGLQVIDAAFVQPDGAGGYFDVAPNSTGEMSNDPGGNGERHYVSATPSLPATPANTGGVGTLAQMHADVGIWFSSDPSTAFLPAAPIGTSRNLWDLGQIEYDGNCDLKGAGGPWGTGSPVAGPGSYYQNEIDPVTCLAGPVGPWQRISYAGSRIGSAGLMGDLQVSVTTSSGWNLSPSNPLPLATNSIRWANGLNSVGEIKYVSITARITSLPPGGVIINESEVWGGDVFYWEGGKDNPWKYNDTLVSIANNSDMTILKIPSVESAAPGDVVSFQIMVINTGARTHTNVQVVDYVNASLDDNGDPALMAQYNLDASSGGVFTPGPSGKTPGSENITWNLPLLNPGAIQTLTYSVTALDPALANPGLKLDELPGDAVDHVEAISDQLLPAPAGHGPAVASASFSIGQFPLLSQSKTVSPAASLPGGTVRYHIQIRNDGAGSAGIYSGMDKNSVPFTAYPVDIAGLPIPSTIRDTLPSGFSYAGNWSLAINGAPAAGVSASAVNQQVTWSIPHTAATPNAIGPAAVLELSFDAVINAAIAPGVYKNDVFSQIPFNVKPKDEAPEAKDWARKSLYSNQTAPVSVGAVQLAKSASPAMVINDGGSQTSYTISISNNGGSAVTGLIVTDTLPNGFSYLAGTTGGSAGVGEPSVTGQQVTWPLFTLAAGASATIMFDAGIDAGVTPAVYYNDVTATAANASIPDLLQAAPVTVAAPGLAISQSVDRANVPWTADGGVTATQVVSYTITLSNSGAATSIVDVSDQLPAGFEFDPALGLEIATLTIAGTPSTLTRGADYAIFPLAATRTPNWGTFSIPPRQGALDTVLTLSFPALVRMSTAADPPANSVVQPGVYANTVTIAGNTSLPAQSGAPVDLYRPVSKSTVTPSVAINGVIDYRLRVDNRETFDWNGVTLSDYLGGLTPVPAPSVAAYAGNAWYAVATNAPAGKPGVDPAWLATAPASAAPLLSFDNAGAGFNIPAGQSLWLAFNATAPAAVPTPPTIHNSVQTLNFTSTAPGSLTVTIADPWDGSDPSNTTEDVNVTAAPTVLLTASKTAAPANLYLNGAAAANAVNYSITLSNPDATISATGVSISDILPTGFAFGAGDTATVSINGGAPVALAPAFAAPMLTISLGANAIPPLGTAIINFTISVNAGTPAGNHYNSFDVSGANVQAASFGPTAPVRIDPVSLVKQATTHLTVAGGVASYRIDLTHLGGEALAGLNLTDALTTGFSYAADTLLTLNGAPLSAGTDYAAPTPGSANPVWTLNVPIPAAVGGAASTLAIEFTANVAASALPGVYDNTVSNLSFTPDAGAPVNIINPYDGALALNTADDVTVGAVDISKAVVSPFDTVTNSPTGTSTQYLITASNASATSQTVSVSDLLPVGFTLQAASTYYATGMNPPISAPPGAGWTATTASTAPPYSTVKPLFDNAGAEFIVPAGQNLFIRFAADIAGIGTPGAAPPGIYDNHVEALIGGAVVASFGGAAVTVLAPQVSLSKITTTANIATDALGNYPNAHYRISITNTGSADATGMVISDVLPPGFTLLAGSAAISINGVAQTAGGFSATQTGQAISFDTLPNGGFDVPAATAGGNGLLTIDYDVTILAGTAPGAYANSASAASDNAGALGPVLANVTLFDVGLVKTTSTPTVLASGTASYSIAIANFSPAAIANVVTVDYLPAGFTYVVGSTLINGVPAADPTGSPGQPVWTIASVPAAGAVTLSFDALVSFTVSPGAYFNTVTASGNGGGVNFPTTGPTAAVTVQTASPLLTVLKTASTATASPGDDVLYSITTQNTGN
ncbi:MAG: hypothetical protein R8K46_04940, partial [Mariprofundaceae bacterium]